MKKSFFALGLIFSSLFLLPASAKTIVQYPFIKDMSFSKNASEIELLLDQEVLSQLNEKARNFTIFDQENNQTPYDLYIEKSARIRDLEVLEVSSKKSSDDELDFIVDNDALTTFRFDLKDGGKDTPAEVLIDLKEPKNITRINIFDSAGPNAKEVLIRGGLNLRKMKTLVSQRAYNYQYDIPLTSVRYLKLYLWGNGIVIDDVRVYGFMDVFAYFTPEAGKKYTLSYGDPSIETTTYLSQLSERKKAERGVLFSQQWNTNYPEDIDKDGLLNSFDNCFLVSNPSQRDSDEDGVGNDCDNAKDSKNVSQGDVDFDGIGDIIDNCKLKYNEQQEDLDRDGIGDVCDGSFTNQKTEISPVSYTILILVLLAVFIMIQFNNIRKKNTKKTAKTKKK